MTENEKKLIEANDNVTIQLVAEMENAAALRSRIAELEAANAAAVLNNQQLREAFQTFIDEHEECQDADDWIAMMCSMEAHHVADEAIATPISTEALDKYVAEKAKELDKIARDCTAGYESALEEIATLTRQRDLAVAALESISKITGDAGFNIGGPLEHCPGDIDGDELKRLLSLSCEYLKDTSKAAFRALSTIKESEGK